MLHKLFIFLVNQSDFGHDPDEIPDKGTEKTIAVATPSNKSVFEKTPKRPEDKRKRVRKNDPEDIEGFLGPWGGFVDEVKVSKPDEVSSVPSNLLTNWLVLELSQNNCAQSCKNRFMFHKFCTNPLSKYTKSHMKVTFKYIYSQIC